MAVAAGYIFPLPCSSAATGMNALNSVCASACQERRGKSRWQREGEGAQNLWVSETCLRNGQDREGIDMIFTFKAVVVKATLHRRGKEDELNNIFSCASDQRGW